MMQSRLFRTKVILRHTHTFEVRKPRNVTLMDKLIFLAPNWWQLFCTNYLKWRRRTMYTRRDAQLNEALNKEMNTFSNLAFVCSSIMGTEILSRPSNKWLNVAGWTVKIEYSNRLSTITWSYVFFFGFWWRYLFVSNEPKRNFNWINNVEWNVF